MGWPDRAAESPCRLAMLLDGTTRNGQNRPQSAGDVMATANEALDALLHEARDVAAIAAGNGERDDLLAGDGNSIAAWRRMKELATQYATCGTFSAYCKERSPTTRRAVQRVLRRRAGRVADCGHQLPR